jgi:hypothetical protein
LGKGASEVEEIEEVADDLSCNGLMQLAENDWGHCARCLDFTCFFC